MKTIQDSINPHFSRRGERPTGCAAIVSVLEREIANRMAQIRASD